MDVSDTGSTTDAVPEPHQVVDVLDAIQRAAEVVVERTTDPEARTLVEAVGDTARWCLIGHDPAAVAAELRAATARCRALPRHRVP